jgi:hypothetical protein
LPAIINQIVQRFESLSGVERVSSNLAPQELTADAERILSTSAARLETAVF